MVILVLILHSLAYWSRVWLFQMLRLALFVTYTIIQSITSSEMCSLHLTHPSALGTVGGLVPCSRVSPQSRTIPAGAEIRTHITSRTLYPLGHDCPIIQAFFLDVFPFKQFSLKVDMKSKRTLFTFILHLPNLIGSDSSSRVKNKLFCNPLHSWLIIPSFFFLLVQYFFLRWFQRF